LEFLLRRYADAVVAIDETVRASLPADLKIDVVHNSFTPTASSEIPQAVADLRSRFNEGSLRVGMVGNLLAMKGVYEFLEAARICVAKGLNVDFVLVGTNPRRLSGLKGFFLRYIGFAHNLEGDIERCVDTYGLGGRLHWPGFMSDVSSVYRSLDLLCFPSHLDAVGRPVIEAAWFGVPSIVALDRSSPDTFIDGKTGVAVPSRNPEALAAAISRLCERRDEVRRMGQAARALAERNFDSKKNACSILAVYERVLAQI
jgi:glycosyltransferase involved in cell wall biosynthesis